ncbi:Endonuclease [Aphelenchoides bicaudatus]|nr:Endonuclease [Aphelenchoides bicaudatus]
MNRYLNPVVISSAASFLLGLQFSDIIKDKYREFSFIRQGHAESVAVESRPLQTLPTINHKSVALTETWKQPSRSSEIMKYGYPGYDNLRTYSDFIVSFNRQTRNAHWVMEHLTSACLEYDSAIDRSKSKFMPDETVHAYFRTQNEDFRGTGFDRGHLAAAGNHRRSQLAMDQTFFLTNMSPQVGKGFNRDKWNDLEKHVRRTARKSLNTYVITGPLYLPKVEADGNSYIRYKVIGKNKNIGVPTHFFKAALIEREEGKFELESWVLPNEAIPDAKPIEDFYIPLDAIERSAGLLIFDKFPKGKLLKINGKKTGGFLF